MESNNIEERIGQEEESSIILESNKTRNWRKAIPDEYLYPNRDWFKRKGVDAPTSIEGLEDNQLLIKLGGLKYVAKLHGYSRVTYKVVDSSRERAVVKCAIEWIIETGKNHFDRETVEFESLASATRENTDLFMQPFLECMAENRAFARAVRNFLGINIVSDEEIFKNLQNGESKNPVEKQEVVEAAMPGPQESLRKVMASKKVADIATLKSNLAAYFENDELPLITPETIASWNSLEDITPHFCRLAIGVLKA